MDTTTIFLFLVFFVLGYVVREFLGGSKKEKKDSSGDTLLRYWIDEQKVQHVELEGQDVSITDGTPEQRRHLAELAHTLQKWAQAGEPAQPAPVVPVPAAAVAVAPAMKAAEPPPAAAIAGTAVVDPGLQAAETPVVSPDEPKENAKPRINLAKGAQMFFSENVSRKVEPKPKTIVSMIDDVLQKKLETSPLQSRKIKLEDGPHGEVVVVVNADRYAGVDQVPDPEIQAIIRESIAEWEHTQS